MRAHQIATIALLGLGWALVLIYSVYLFAPCFVPSPWPTWTQDCVAGTLTLLP
jgi:hypothetical protein